MTTIGRRRADVGRIQERSEQSAVFSTAKDLALAQQTARQLNCHE